jgi:hypothetical protein
LTQVVSDTHGGTSTFGETIITFYEYVQLDSGKPNTPGSSNTLSNSIPCVSNYPFVMGNQLTKKERNQVIDFKDGIIFQYFPSNFLMVYCLENK